MQEPVPLCFFAVNADLLSLLVVSLELDSSVDLRKESVVSALANIVARMELRASLSHENGSSTYEFTGAYLESKTFRLGVSAVLGTSYSFFT